LRGGAVAACASNRSSASVSVQANDFNTAGQQAALLGNGNVAPAANAAQQDAVVFAYDYSAMGIPAAPGSSGYARPAASARTFRAGAAGRRLTTRPAGTLVRALRITAGPELYGVRRIRFSFLRLVEFQWRCECQRAWRTMETLRAGRTTSWSWWEPSGTRSAVRGEYHAWRAARFDGRRRGFATTGDGGITNDYRVLPPPPGRSRRWLPADLLPPDLFRHHGGLLPDCFSATPHRAPLASRPVLPLPNTAGRPPLPHARLDSTQAGSFRVCLASCP